MVKLGALDRVGQCKSIVERGYDLFYIFLRHVYGIVKVIR